MEGHCSYWEALALQEELDSHPCHQAEEGAEGSRLPCEGPAVQGIPQAVGVASQGVWEAWALPAKGVVAVLEVATAGHSQGTHHRHQGTQRVAYCWGGHSQDSPDSLQDPGVPEVHVDPHSARSWVGARMEASVVAAQAFPEVQGDRRHTSGVVAPCWADHWSEGSLQAPGGEGVPQGVQGDPGEEVLLPHGEGPRLWTTGCCLFVQPAFLVQARLGYCSGVYGGITGLVTNSILFR